MQIIEIIFFTLIFLTLYSYIIYPLVLVVLAKFFNKGIVATESTPSVSVIISAFNEEKVISNKINNTLKLDYPKNKLEIIVISDHSTDKTDEIVQSYSDRNVTLISSSVRRGKTAGLNDVVPKLSSNVVVFSDADAMYNKDVLRKMVHLLSDPDVGLVTGSTEYMSEGNGEIVMASGIYTRLERFIKKYESKISSCVGADGAIFALKKDQYKPLSDHDINDLIIPLNVVKQGYRVILGDDLYCSEMASVDINSEFRRQVRITTRTLWALFNNIALMNFIKYPLFSFELLSHKIIRFSIPSFMIILLPLNYALINYGLIYKLLFIGQLVFYLMAVLGYLLEKTDKSIKIIEFIYYFVMIQSSIFLGWCNFIMGKKQVIWNPRN